MAEKPSLSPEKSPAIPATLSNPTLDSELPDEVSPESLALFTDIDNLKTELPNYLMKQQVLKSLERLTNSKTKQECQLLM